MAFDLSDVLKTVSDKDTEEQIVRIDLDLIDPDPENFYSLDGLDALASNIELIGLQQPLRVRPGENGRFTVVSGHRRRAACLQIRDGGSDQFAKGVPCIVEYGEASDAMRKLRLIFANSSTRVLTSAEISKQAEEVEALLYELQEQGVVFPGRMRDHVAAAVQKSKSKLARLHAIRANLIPEILTAFDENKLPENTAYQLSRYPVEIQRAVVERMAQPKVTNWPNGSALEEFRDQVEKYMTPAACHAKAGATCSNCEQRVLHNLFNYSWAWCHYDCCLDCAKGNRDCPFMCKAGKDRLKLDRAVEAEKEAERKAIAASRKEIEQKALRKEAARLLKLAEAAGLKDESCISPTGNANVGRLREMAAGTREPARWDLVPYNLEEAKRWAKTLKCTVSELIGEKLPAPAPAAELTPTWQTGKPKKAGLYAVRFKVSETAPGELHNFAVWDNFQWKAVRSGKVITDLIAAGWYPLPALENMGEVTEE